MSHDAAFLGMISFNLLAFTALFTMKIQWKWDPAPIPRWVMLAIAASTTVQIIVVVFWATFR
jgi:hypothetical protein